MSSKQKKTNARKQNKKRTTPPKGKKKAQKRSNYRLPSLDAPVQYDNRMAKIGARQTGRIKHAEWGDGIRVEGLDVIAAMGMVNGGTGVFSSYATLPGNSSTKLMLHPNNLPRLSIVSQGYSRYVFRQISLEYCPQVGTGTAGQAALALSQDAGLSNNGSFAKVLANTGAKAVQWFKKVGLPALKYSGLTTYPLIEAATGTADYILRSWAQGSIIGANTDFANSSLTYGQLCVRYVVDLFGLQQGQFGSTLLAIELKFIASDEQLCYIADRLRKERERRFQEEEEKQAGLRHEREQEAEHMFVTLFTSFSSTSGRESSGLMARAFSPTERTERKSRV